ncbi:hypothetical protein CAOG_09051 [Capsaspora owczarzaki ATCC 30864]|uniref:Golvesin/Xly CBD-like domain-containing protein n=1 Tax=Capsaspora owczarzaki (strain ATCC 30864) TaxID=595528 RepID=A0A0D2UPJ7_CAPO3|nr:hypothetical protein CAOG_09051 [Capsaspora owczarzaki ATCC 30864]KJE96936.1 hypothetical protein CAOG_009051 [Capsaspora owczarzaki ATCC 30864]|eukprot:XP_011270739.1 hypothetical protein CAOG_09051 [Capsaspora owczarzaki ATCC 30864]
MTAARSLVVVGALLAVVALTAHADIHNLPTKWVDVTSSTAPQLSTKNVVLSPALGWLTCSGSTGGYRSTGSSYFSQESLLQDLYTNEISIRYVQEYLANAGASVHSTRERWFDTPTEVIINDVDTATAKKVTYTGSGWDSATSVAGYGSNQHWVPGSTSESAQATFTATLTTSGYYPVYMTWPATSNRGSPDIRITHSGGIQTVSVPMYQFDSIFVYLGRYYFTAAAGIKVEITNKMTVISGKFAMVDAVRVGCGASTAGIPRWKLSAQDFLYYMSQGQYSTLGLQVAANSAPTLDTDYLARAKFSTYMFNQKLDINFANTQVGSDWLYAGIGASGGSGSGVSTVTPNTNPSGLSATLYTACSTAATSVRVNVQQATGQNNQGGSLDASKTELTQNTKMPSFITYTIDVFNSTEMGLMAKESYRETLGRAIYKGIHKYFVPSSPTIIPLPVTNLYTVSRTDSVALCWVQPTDPLESSATPTAYKLYTSTDGRGWDAGVIFGPTGANVALEGNFGNSVCGGTRLVAVDTQYYFKVVGVNAGGEALTKLTVAGYRNSGSSPRILVVDAFDADFVHASDNIEGRYTREYVYEYASALQAAGYRCDSATKNTLLDATWVNAYLVNYDTVIWFATSSIGASGVPGGSGVSTVTPDSNPGGLSAALYTACSTVADSVRVNIQQATGQNNKGGVLDSSKTELTRNAYMPSFITYTIDVFNGTEMALMAKESYRETLGRAIYKGIHKYFNSSAIIIPLPVTNLYTVSMTDGVALCWVQPTDPLESSATPTAYKLYTSTDGRGWDAGVIFGPTSSSSVYFDGTYGNSICGITTTVAVDTQYYFKVAGVNAGGEALTKLTAAGYRYTGARPRVVVIDAFDADFIHTSDNIEGRYTREYVYEYVSALQAAGYRCETATKNSLLDTTWVADYFMNFDTVIWFAGENTGINVLPAAHQAVINTWIAAANITKPRSLVVSGSHVASGLAAAGGASATFLANNLGAGYAGSTASAPFVARQAVDPGFTMSGTVTFNSVIALGNPYLVQTPDILTTVGNGMAALYYGASSGTNIAGVSTVGGSYSSFLLAMPFETIKSSTERTTLMTSIVKSVIQRRASSAISAATASAATVVSTSRASVASQLSAASASAMSSSVASFASKASVASQLSAASASAMSSSVASFASKASVASQLSAASASAISTSVASFASVASVASVSSDAFVASTSIAFVTSAASVATASVASVASDASAASTSIEFVTSAASVATASVASVASDASAASTSIEFVTSAASVATASVASVASDASAASTSIEFVTSAASVATASVASVASDASIASTSVEFVTSAASVATVSAASIASDAYVASTSIAFVTSVTSAAVASSTKASVASVASTAFAHSTSSSHSASTSKATAHFASTSSAHITTADVSASGASISSAATTVPASLATIASSAASPASASLEPANASSFPIGPVVGGVVGGLILLILVVILLVTLLRRRRNTKKEQGPGSVERNSLPDPVADDSVGTFANPLFQQMDDNLGDASTPAADSQLAASKLEESGLRE